MTEFGLFSDDGLIESGFFSREDAAEALTHYDADDGLHVAEVCPDHDEQERACCELCDAEDDGEDLSGATDYPVKY